jgi:hypothetical protein
MPRVRVVSRLLPFVMTCALLALLLPGAAVAAAPKLKDGLKGIQIARIGSGTTAAAIDRDLDEARALGARVVRSDVSWRSIEPQRGAYDQGYLAQVDHLMAGAAQRKMKVFLTVLETPCWTTTQPEADCSTARGRDEAAAYPPADVAAFARVAALVAARWATGLAALEIWNEPDQINELYWKGPDKVRRYAALLKAAYPAVKAAAPTVPVAGAAIVGSNGKFLQALYDQGIKGSYDLLSVHYYDLVLLSLGEIRAVRRKAGDTKPLWLGEYGWTSCLTKKRRMQGQHICIDRRTQAENVVDVLRAFAKQGDLAGATLYGLRDNSEYAFGVLDTHGRRKPSFTAVSRAFHGRLGAERKIVVRLARRGSHLVATGSGPAGDAFVLSATNHGRLVYRLSYRADRSNRFRVVLPPVVGVQDVVVRVRRYSVSGRAAVARR